MGKFVHQTWEFLSGLVVLSLSDGRPLKSNNKFQPMSQFQNGKQIPNLVVHILERGDGVCDLFSQELAISLPHSMRGHLGGRLAHAQPGGGCGIGRARVVAHNEAFQLLKLRRLAALGEFTFQPLDDQFQQGDRPLAIKKRDM